MDSKPDTIKISASQKEEISATHADLHVTVKGSSIVSGNEALSQVQVKEEAVKLQGVRMEAASGTLLKSSSAVYRLKIRCEDLGMFAGILDVVASQKNATLERVEWKYGEDEVRARVLGEVIEKAKLKAGRVAASLGVKLLGIYDFIENTFDEETPGMFQPQMMVKRGATLTASAAPEPSLGMDVQHSKTVHVNVDVWYRVSEF